jgi:hypothetical protein
MTRQAYRLERGFPAIGLGFQAIDTRRIGPKGFRE